tara:strand:- start:175 stop:540 length:366 start_codon:yes stop_codon:yes gene_type:complete
MARIKQSYLRVLIEHQIPTVVCTQYEDRFAGYNVIPKDVFMAFPREYTALIEDPLKVRDPENRDIVTLPCNEADRVFFHNNFNKFKKAYEAKGEKVFETVYGSLKELRRGNPPKRKVRKKT